MHVRAVEPTTTTPARYSNPVHTHLVQGEGEMRVKLLKACGNVSALLASVDAGHEEVDKPCQAVLVDRLDVGQV